VQRLGQGGEVTRRTRGARTEDATMGMTWQVELNPDVTVTTDGTRCRIGGVVSVTFEIADVEFVWSEVADATLEPGGLLNLQLKDRPGTLASIRMKRHEALQVRTMLESGGPLPH
jgi:hypothetical protein